MSKYKVTIMQYRLFHYRVELFETMRRLCSKLDIDLNVVYGQAYRGEILKKDEGLLSWGRSVNNYYFPVKEKKDLCWQPLPLDLIDSDLLVFMQENRLLSNYYWIIRRRLGLGPKVAFWGHGKDFQSRVPGGFRERWKRKTINWVDWWFAYTRITCEQLKLVHFPEGKTTCLNNAIDVRGLRRDWDSISDEMRNGIANECGISNESIVGLFCGSLYSDKKLDLLVSACDLVVTRYPNFKLVVIGDGAERPKLLEQFATRPWASSVGTKRGKEKAAYFGLSTLVLNPGLVGLHVLDAFSMGLPMITTLTAQHSPEISYLEDGVNGLMTDETPAAYAEAVIALLADPAKLRRMSDQAIKTADLYTVENMATNFVLGIERALALPA